MATTFFAPRGWDCFFSGICVQKDVSTNQDLSVSPKSTRLKGKRLAMAVCGGIGAVEVVKIIRELRRHGAEVFPFMTPSAGGFITPLSVSWAAGREVASESGYEANHLTPFDLVIVAPATLNTIAKAALALADNSVGLLLASHIGGRKPVLFVPAMNAGMKRHPEFENYRQKLESWGGHFLVPEEEEDRLKMPTPETLAAWACENLK